jgi:hypothetical protein
LAILLSPEVDRRFPRCPRKSASRLTSKRRPCPPLPLRHRNIKKAAAVDSLLRFRA